jgi:hypothetical protein
LGKLAVTSLSSVFVVVAVLPVLAFPVLLGGVTGVDYWKTILVLLNTLLLSLSVGVLVSAFSSNERAAVVSPN